MKPLKVIYVISIILYSIAGYYILLDAGISVLSYLVMLLMGATITLNIQNLLKSNE